MPAIRLVGHDEVFWERQEMFCSIILRYSKFRNYSDRIGIKRSNELDKNASHDFRQR